MPDLSALGLGLVVFSVFTFLVLAGLLILATVGLAMVARRMERMHDARNTPDNVTPITPRRRRDFDLGQLRVDERE